MTVEVGPKVEFRPTVEVGPSELPRDWTGEIGFEKKF